MKPVALDGLAAGSAAATAVTPAAPAAGDGALWPDSKLLATLQSWPGKPPEKGYAVVVTTGAMNPIHLGHAQLLRQAKVRLEAAGFGILGAWASPSHDGYVQPKCKSLKTMGLSAAFRLEVARHLLTDDDLVDVGSWEAKQPGSWPDYPVVVKALQKELASQPYAKQLKGPNGHVRVFYACGTDHASKCNLYNGLKPEQDVGVVVVPRSGERARGEKPAKGVYVAAAADGAVAALSSTKVRAALKEQNFDAVATAMSAGGARFLLRPTVDEYEAFAADYGKLGIRAPTP